MTTNTQPCDRYHTEKRARSHLRTPHGDRKQECLSKLILFGERPLRRALQQYVAHYHEERNHQGKQNRLLFPLRNRGASEDNGIVRCKERLGGLLKYYEREAA